MSELSQALFEVFIAILYLPSRAPLSGCVVTFAIIKSLKLSCFFLGGKGIQVLRKDST